LDNGRARERPVLRPRRDDDCYCELAGIVANADKRLGFVRAAAKACSLPIMVLLVIAALGPEKWAPRTHLGWQFDHFIGYFGITFYFAFAWRRRFLVGGVFMVVAGLLEGLQAFTPDRIPYLPAALYGAGGALAAALIAELFIRARSWRLTVLEVTEVTNVASSAQ
jgi:VanZ family protein